MANLFDRTKIGNLKLRNRIFMSPMGTGTDPDGGYSEQTRECYTERAAGGFAMIFTGTAVCCDKYEAKAANRLTNFQMIERLQRVAESVHAQGAKLCLQLGAGSGRMALPEVDRAPHAPSAVPCTFVPEMTCIPFTIEEIKDLEAHYGMAAKWAKAAGCDAIQVHGYGGYLTDQFMSAEFNHRTDEYGGSLENRMRFPLNLIKQIKENCGEDFPIFFKMTLTHHTEHGRTIEEGLEIAKMLEKAGVAEIEVDHGSFEHWYLPIPTVYDDFGGKLEMAAKVKEGRFEDIRYCIGCLDCLQGEVEGRMPACAVNPRVGFENFSDLTPAKEPKKVLVIGGGVAGMQTALTAAERGHKVTIWEKENRLGGIANAAAAPRIKKSVRDYLDNMSTQVEKQRNITVVYNKEATMADIERFNPDKVVLATGAHSIIPPVPGLRDNPRVSVATDYLLDKFHAEGNILVIGAGLVGLETAIEAAQRGSKVSVVEMLDRILVEQSACIHVQMPR